MQLRAEIMDLAGAINGDAPGAALRLREGDLARLERILREHPEVWPVGLADTFTLLRDKLRLEPVDRQAVPEALGGFFDEVFRRDLDPMALARHIGQDLCSACAGCECRC